MANTISRFVSSLQFTQRLFTSISIGILLLASIMAFQWSEYKTEWNSAVKNYDVAIKAREKLIVEMKASAKAYREKTLHEHALKVEACGKLKVDDIKRILSGCFGLSDSLVFPEISAPDYPVAVQPFNRYVRDEYLGNNIARSGIFAISIFILLSIISQYHNEKSKGWKRLSVVSSVLISALIGLYVYDNNSHYYSNNDEVFGAIVISYPVSLLMLLYAKGIYDWIKDGFNADQEPSTSKVMQSPVTTNQSIQEQENLPETDTLKEAAGASTTLQSSKLNIAQDSVERKELIKSITQIMQRLYRGEVSLVYTYWIFGVVVGNVVPLILLGFLSLVNEPPLFILIISIIASVAWMWFISVAIWRSATNYNNNVKQGSICADLAKVSVFIGVGTIVVKVIFGILDKIH